MKEVDHRVSSKRSENIFGKLYLGVFYYFDVRYEHTDCQILTQAKFFSNSYGEIKFI